jgi:hypothetical protein
MLLLAPVNLTYAPTQEDREGVDAAAELPQTRQTESTMTAIAYPGASAA